MLCNINALYRYFRIWKKEFRAIGISLVSLLIFLFYRASFSCLRDIGIINRRLATIVILVV